MKTIEEVATLPKIILTVILLMIFSLGVAKTLDSSVASISHSLNTSQAMTDLSVMDATFTNDVAESKGFIVSSSKITSQKVLTQCSTWNPNDSAFRSVRPLVTFFQPLNSNSATGVRLFNTYIGYEVRSVHGSYGQLWRVECISAQGAQTSVTGKMLRSDLPLPSSNSAWASSTKCLMFVASAVSTGSCASNKFLNDSALNPGLTFTVPASVGLKTNLYPTQVLMAARSN